MELARTTVTGQSPELPPKHGSLAAGWVGVGGGLLLPSGQGSELPHPHCPQKPCLRGHSLVLTLLDCEQVNTHVSSLCSQKCSLHAPLHSS